MLQIAILLLAAVVFGRLAQRWGLSAVAGELCAGVLLGPTVLGGAWPWLGDQLRLGPPDAPKMFESVGQVGVVLLVGLAGAQLDLALVRRRGATAVRISLAGLIIPLTLGVATGLLLSGALIPDGADRTTFALFLGVAMGVSAIPVIAKTLTELRLLHRNVGQLVLCAVTVDDIVGWILLSIVTAMATTGVEAGSVGRSVLSVAAVLVVAALARPLLARLLRAADRADEAHGDAVTITVTALVIVAGAAGAAQLDLEPVFGAFVAGIAVGSCGLPRPARLAPLNTTVMAVLAPVFFASAGLRMDLGALLHPAVLLTGLLVLAIAIAGKFAGAYLGGRLSGISHWESLALGAGMNARGVIEVIIASVGLRLGILGIEMYTIIIVVAVVTSLMAPPLLRRAMARVESTTEEELRAEAGLVSPVNEKL